MVAYNFKPRFRGAIATGKKTQTIRPGSTGKRHARIGEPVQLYTGMRTSNCRKITRDPVCIRSEPILIDVPVSPDAPAFYRFPDRPEHSFTLIDDRFAQDDGFAGAEDMVRFFFDEHGPGIFRGHLIVWRLEKPNRRKSCS